MPWVTMSLVMRELVALPRSVVWFWAIILGGAALGAAWLDYLGPPTENPPIVTIAAPSAALSRPSIYNAAWSIPRPSPYGVPPKHYYAAPPPPREPHQARIALLVTGFGALNGPGPDAIAHLPAYVAIAITPFGLELHQLARAARRSGHETLVSLPIGGVSARQEPYILSIGNQSDVNGRALDWALSRFEGYVGVTDAGGLSTSGRFLQDPADAFWLINSLKADGLFMLDINPAAALPDGPDTGRASVVMTADQGVTGLKAGLVRLTRLAHRSGSAIGVIESPNSAELAALTAWAAHRPATTALVPVSALIATGAHK
ncbi:divergent polysaccharide deacetylase family protein [Acidiphilium sp. MT5]